MIHYHREVLDNGLRVLLHEDPATELVAVNLIYDVGSKDEDPECTGFAHLFEHLMFGGSRNAASFDDPIQYAGGECNAFTNSDLTNFFCLLPADNLELALFLEADRMSQLVLNEQVLAVQRQVVSEEFKETCLQQPYGDMWHLLAPLAYHEHTYRWPTIGSSLEHIEKAGMHNVADFYRSYYGPNNAICVISGNIQEQAALRQVQKTFGEVPPRHRPDRMLPVEPIQNAMRRQTVRAEVPIDALYMAFHMPGRTGAGFYACDILSDILAGGKSSRLYEKMVKEKSLCTDVDAYVTGSIDPGLFVFEAKPSDGISLEEVENNIWSIIEDIQSEPVPLEELQTHQNKIESSIYFSNCSVLNKSMNLAFYELIGEPGLINTEHREFQRITPEMITDIAQRVLRRENCSVLEYLAG